LADQIFIIRNKKSGDDEAAARLVAEAFRGKYDVLADGDWDKASKIAEAEMRCRGRMDNFFVAVRGSRVIGAIEIISPEIQGIPSGEMLSIYFKQLGLGKGLRASYLLSLLSRVVDSDEACVSSLAVADEARGRGVGRALLSSGEQFAREIGKKSLTLWVTETNSSAIKLYESAGFETIRHSNSTHLKKFFDLESWRQMSKNLETTI